MLHCCVTVLHSMSQYSLWSHNAALKCYSSLLWCHILNSVEKVLPCGATVLHCGFTVLHCGVTVLHYGVPLLQCVVTVLQCGIRCSNDVPQFPIVVSLCSTVVLP